MRPTHILLILTTVIPGPCGHVDDWIADYFELSPESRLEKIHDFTIEQQLKLHLVASCVRRPGSDELEAVVSENGRRLDSALVNELRAAQSECDVVALMRVADESQEAEGGCVSEEVFAQASARARSLRIADRKAKAKQLLEGLTPCG